MPENFGLMDKAPPPEKKESKKTEKPKPKMTPVTEVVTYYSVKRNQRIRLRPPIKQYVNGREFKQPGLSVEFFNFQLQTKNEEVINELDEMLYGERGAKWRKIFYRAPNSKTVKVMTEAAKKAKAVEKDALKKELGEDGMEELDNWNKFLTARKKGKVEVETGMRAVKMG